MSDLINKYLGSEISEGFLLKATLTKEYLTKFDFEGKKQKGWSKDKKKAMVFPDRGSVEKALEILKLDKPGYGSIVKV